MVGGFARHKLKAEGFQFSFITLYWRPRPVQRSSSFPSCRIMRFPRALVCRVLARLGHSHAMAWQVLESLVKVHLSSMLPTIAHVIHTDQSCFESHLSTSCLNLSLRSGLGHVRAASGSLSLLWVGTLSSAPLLAKL